MKIINLALVTVFALISSNTALAGNLKGKLLGCAKVGDSLERLVCYDALAKNSAVIKHKKQAIGKQDHKVPTVAKKVIVETEKDFGADHIEKTDADRDAELNEVTFTISSISTNSHGKKFITFSNGQKWKQTDGGHMRLAKNEQVNLSKGTFGVVFLKKINKNKKIKIKRIM